MTKRKFQEPVDEEIYSCLDLDNPKSFFLLAGAGSGKTRSLVEVLKNFRDENIQRLRLNGQKIGVITYTNAACDEIRQRLDFDPSFEILTIHSFSWELIKPYHKDIRNWIRSALQAEIAELEDKQQKGRTNSKASQDRPRQIAAKNRRLDLLNSISKFSYNPNGENIGRNSLNHEEVIQLTTYFLNKKELMQKILVRKYPILLIDESQDTREELIDAFINIQSVYSDTFTLGLFGDVMQRIYMDGKEKLDESIPPSWVKPQKLTNHRSPKRVVDLINKIRSADDHLVQEPRDDAEEGFVRLFIADTSGDIDKVAFEHSVAKEMAKITGDMNWENPEEIKLLMLEHRMAARRGGFSHFFESLAAVDRLRTRLRDGSLLVGIAPLANQVLPLIQALRKNNKFAVMRIIREHSMLLQRDYLKNNPAPLDVLSQAKNAVQNLYALWEKGNSPLLRDILIEIDKSKLFELSDTFKILVERLKAEETTSVVGEADQSDKDETIEAWYTALNSPFKEFEAYVDYVSEKSRFGTHQGIKGRQFPRVMVIMDDEEAGGFLFSYDKLLGAKPPTKTDQQNTIEGKDNSIDRTRRLFYVTCSRAEKSLALVAYTQNPKEVQNYVITQEWFRNDEIIV